LFQCNRSLPCRHFPLFRLAMLYKVCSKKDRIFAIKTLFYNILSTVPFKVVPSIGDTPSPTFLPLLECFLERTFCDGAQFSYRIFLNLRVFKKRPNFLNSVPSVLVGALFKKFCLFLNTGVQCTLSPYANCMPLLSQYGKGDFLRYISGVHRIGQSSQFVINLFASEVKSCSCPVHQLPTVQLPSFTRTQIPYSINQQ
jgi:hypothetical protein